MGGQAFFKRGRIFLFLWYSLTSLPLYSSYVIHMSVNHWYLSYNFSTCCVDVRMSGPCCKNEMLCCGAEASKRLTKAPKNEHKKKVMHLFFLVFLKMREIDRIPTPSAIIQYHQTSCSMTFSAISLRNNVPGSPNSCKIIFYADSYRRMTASKKSPINKYI